MPRRRYLDTPHGQVHALETGELRPGVLPLVLLHQTASCSLMFESVMAHLSADTYVFAPDTPGFGGTPAPVDTASVELYVEVLLAAIDAAGIERFFLFGHHSGASIAAEMAARHPGRIERLVLSGPPLLTHEQIERLIPTVCPVRLEADGSHLTAVWQRIRAKDPTAPVELSHREAVLNLWAGVRYPEAYRAVFQHDLAAALRELRCPTLIMVGENDTIRASAEPARDLVPDAELAVLPEGGTYICDRYPELVASTIQTFLSKEIARV